MPSLDSIHVSKAWKQSMFIKHIIKTLEHKQQKMLESQNVYNEYSSKYLEQGYNE